MMPNLVNKPSRDLMLLSMKPGETATLITPFCTTVRSYRQSVCVWANRKWGKLSYTTTIKDGNIVVKRYA